MKSHQHDDTGEIGSGAASESVADAAQQMRLKLHVVPTLEPRRAQQTQPTAAVQLALGVTEAFVIVLMSILAGEAYHWLVLGTAGHLVLWTAIGLLSAIFFCGAMRGIEANQRFRNVSGIEAMRDVTVVWVVTILLVTFFAFSFKAGATLSRGFMLSFMVLGYAGVIAVRSFVPAMAAKYLRSSKFMDHQVIVVGAEGDTAVNTLLGELEAAGHASPHVITFRASAAAHEWQWELSRVIERVIQRAHTGVHGEICIAAGGFPENRLREVIAGLQIVPRAVRVVPSPAIEQFLHFPVRSIGGLYAIELQRTPLNTFQLMAKRALDVTLATAGMIAILPMLLLVAAAVRLDSKGPVLFKQTRLGLRGAPFAIYKFRTMTVTENGDDVKQARQGDNRITGVGRWLRRLSIDELPQLLNVVRGEMSLVGPRPHAMSMDRHYGDLIENYEVRQHVKPGMTGWAQVNGLRGPTESPEQMRRRVEFDIWYAKNASLALDVKILLLTCVEVLRQRNAH